MPQKRREPESNSSRVSLHIGPSFTSAWDDIVRPWFDAAALNALKAGEPAVVVTPFPSGAAFLRSKLLERGTPLLGVKFLTPPLLREFLLADSAATVPLREHLRLLLAIAAETIATKHAENVDLSAIAKSIVRS